MKFSTVLAAMATTALAAPASTASDDDDIIAITNQYSFQLTLPAFLKKRDAQDPASLDWSTDACSFSPDNPLGFPFEPCCYRHDFGYRNFKAQNRFDQFKPQIDLKFLSDLTNQCGSVKTGLKTVCKALAKVYYEAVKTFGKVGSEIDKRDSYEDAVAEYESAFRDAQSKGLIPADMNP